MTTNEQAYRGALRKLDEQAETLQLQNKEMQGRLKAYASYVTRDMRHQYGRLRGILQHTRALLRHCISHSRRLIFGSTYRAPDSLSKREEQSGEEDQKAVKRRVRKDKYILRQIYALSDVLKREGQVVDVSSAEQSDVNKYTLQLDNWLEVIDRHCDGTLLSKAVKTAKSGLRAWERAVKAFRKAHQRYVNDPRGSTAGSSSRSDSKSPSRSLGERTD